MKIRAAVIRQMGLPQPYADSKPMSIEQVELDKPGQREVLVQIKAASLCHSDLSTVNGDRPRQMPMVLGHEASGVVQEVGGNPYGFMTSVWDTEFLSMYRTGNFYRLETSRYDLGKYNDLIETPLDNSGGSLHLPALPGLGLTMNMDYFRKHAVEGYSG